MKCPKCKKENDADSKFCVFCGSDLTGAEPAAPDKPAAAKKATRTRAAKQASAQPGGEEPAASPAAEPDPRKNKVVLKAVLIGGLAIAGLAVLGLLVSSMMGGGFSGGANQVLYGIKDSTYDEMYDALMAVDLNGKNNREMYEGFPTYVYWELDYEQYIFKILYFSPNSLLLQFIDYQEEEVVVLNLKDGTYSSYPLQGDELLISSFSSDGKYLFIVEREGDAIATYIYDADGKQVQSFNMMILLDNIPGKNTYLGIKLTDDQTRVSPADEMGLIQLPSGDYTFLTSLDPDEDLDQTWMSPKGDAVYYVSGDTLMKTSTNDGQTTSIYEGTEDVGFNFRMSSDGRTCAVIDQDRNTLQLIDLRKGSQTRLDRDVAAALFTPDGRQVVYITDEGSSEFDLYIARTNGSDKLRLGRDISRIDFQIAPDGRSIAYTEKTTTNAGGNLMVIDMDGKNLLRLDTDVWSFRYLDGKTLVYSRVEALEKGSPESEIYSIDISGRNKKQLVEVDDGLFEIIWPAP